MIQWAAHSLRHRHKYSYWSFISTSDRYPQWYWAHGVSSLWIKERKEQSNVYEKNESHPRPINSSREYYWNTVFFVASLLQFSLIVFFLHRQLFCGFIVKCVFFFHWVSWVELNDKILYLAILTLAHIDRIIRLYGFIAIIFARV